MRYLVTDQVPPFQEWQQPLYLIKWEPIPQSHQNGHALTSYHVRLHLLVISKRPSVTRLSIPSNWPSTSIQRMAVDLISDHVGTNPTVILEWINTHIWHGRNQSSHHDRMAQPLHLTMEGTNPLTMSEWLTDSSLPLGRNLDLENTKLLPEVLKLHFG